MKLIATILLSVACLSTAFQVQPRTQGAVGAFSSSSAATRGTTTTTTPLYGFLGDKERDGLTRDSEPEEFFATNTDKMSDEEKLPIAIAGVAFITLPFIAGLIALYSAQQ